MPGTQARHPAIPRVARDITERNQPKKNSARRSCWLQSSTIFVAMLIKVAATLRLRGSSRTTSLSGRRVDVAHRILESL